MAATPPFDIPFGRPMLGTEERSAVSDVLNSPQLVHGPRAKEFEEAFAAFVGHGAHATSVSSCTAGLHLAYMHLGFGPGDEVILPALTHVATAHAVEVTGARPVFIDSDVTGNMDLDALNDAVSPMTRGICVVHYPGLPVDMRAVMDIANVHGLSVVEDCALAIGAYLDGTHVGLFGDVSSFSFYPAKHMTTGEGGMVVSKDPDVTTSISSIRAFGYDRSPADRRVPGVYDIAQLGLNYRMGEVAAAIGFEQLKKLHSFAEARRANMDRLRKNLVDLPLTLLPDSDERRVHANYCLIAKLDSEVAHMRDDLLLGLQAYGIGASVYYPVPLPLSRYYSKKYPTGRSNFGNASKISYESIALPVGPHLNLADMDTIAEKMSELLGEKKLCQT